MSFRINELFGPTIQGEGPDIGKPCYFIRFHHCPVKCPGCDSFFTWNGAEKGEEATVAGLSDWMKGKNAEHPKCGYVVTGGEPLLHFRNGELGKLFSTYKYGSWISLETSGFVGPRPIADADAFADYLTSFSRVVVSPKITPCLHGAGWTDDQLETNIPLIFEVGVSCRRIYGLQMSLKFVARDALDIAAIKGFLKRHKTALDDLKPDIYLMPYGIQPEEVTAGCDRLLPYLAEEGWILSPRVHALLWGAKRGV